jgi:hypothetical protein
MVLGIPMWLVIIITATTAFGEQHTQAKRGYGQFPFTSSKGQIETRAIYLKIEIHRY